LFFTSECAYNNLLFGLIARIVVSVSFSICTNLCTSACYIKHMLEQQVDGENLCIIKMILIVLYTYFVNEILALRTAFPHRF
jgi:hypothetical protein